ncbi:MAG: T9SS type A sorting domain-containing protein, partial [Bacteroidales bacterium]|nr:T9SS type A sorting domain-containing protein [Bacteroidales bacterium]
MKKIFSYLLTAFVFAAISLSAQTSIYTPELVSPENEDTDQMPDVVLNWNAVTGGAGDITYECKLAMDAAFTDPVTFITEFTGVQCEYLLFGTEYFWKVRATDGINTSYWSETWSFITVKRIVIKRPKDLYTYGIDPEIRWDIISGVTSYEIQIDTTYSWNLMNSNTLRQLNDVCFINLSNGWAVGKNGTILYFNGTEWSEQTSGTTKDLCSVNFIDATNGWAVGKNGTILYFNGTEWSEQTSGTNENLNGIHFLDAANGWAVGDSAKILFYNGTEWSEQSSGIYNDLNSVQFLDETNGWAVGDSARILFYNGTEWSEQSSEVTKDLYSLFFLDYNNGWAVGKSGMILYFNGSSWTKQESPISKDLYAVSFIDIENGYIFGKDGKMLKYDKNEWINNTSGTEEAINCISIYNSENGLAVGKKGTILYFDGTVFNSPYAHIETLDNISGSSNIYNLFFGDKFFWRLRAVHTLDESDWSEIWSFYTISTLGLKEPINGAINQGLDVYTEWDKITGIVNYIVQVDDDPAFGSPEIFYPDTNSAYVDMFTFGNTYNWRVCAAHLYDTSGWSEVWTFETINEVLLTSPEDGMVNVIRLPVLEWEEILGITEYQLQYNTTPDFTDPVADELILAGTHEFQVVYILDEGQEYFWRARAIHGIDTSAWGEVWSFTVVSGAGINDDLFSRSNINVYPNPSSGKIFLDINTNQSFNIKYSIIDLLGQVFIKNKINLNQGTNSEEILLNELPNG